MSQEEIENTQYEEISAFTFENLMILITGLFVLACHCAMLQVTFNKNMTPEFAKTQIWSILVYYGTSISIFFFIMNLKNIYRYIFKK